jgi:hypothetical protein
MLDQQNASGVISEHKEEIPVQTNRSMRNKRLIGAVITLILIMSGFIVYRFFFIREKNFQIFPIINSNDITKPNTPIITYAATGWSVNDSPALAVTEAISKAKLKLTDRKNITYAYVVSTVGYNTNTVFTEVKKQLDPKTKIQGLTSSIGVMTEEGLFTGKIGSIGVLLIGGDNNIFGQSLTDMSDNPPATESGKKAITEAIQNAGKTLQEKPNLIIMNGPPFRDDDMAFLDGIAGVVGNDVTVIGGTSGNDTNDPTWRQFTNNKITTNGVLVTAIYTPKKIGYSFESAYRMSDKSGMVNKSQGKVLYEIDGRPALDVYSDWVGSALVDKLKNDKDTNGIAQFTAHYPLGLTVKGDNGQIGYYTLHPVPTINDLTTRTLTMGGPVPQSSEIKLYFNSWQTTLSQAESIPSQALIQGNMNVQDSDFGILTLSRGAALSLPEGELSKVPLLTKNILAKTPFIGVISRSELGPIEGIRNVSANLMESMVIFGK